MPGTTKRRSFKDTALDYNTVGRAFDAFSNQGSRLGFGTPNLMGSTSYPLSRFSFDYWGLISLYEDHWIVRRIVDVPAEDMVRCWPRIVGDIDPDDVARVDNCLRKTQTQKSYLTGLKWGRLFGGAGSLIVIEGHEDRLDEPLDPEDVLPGSYKGLIPFDMWAGIQPDPASICLDFNYPEDVNRPEFYRVQATGGKSFRVHSSRILRHVGYENPTPERETYQWWGISVIQPVIQEIEKRDNVSFNIMGLTFRANLLAMKDKELAERLSGLGASAKANRQWERRMSETNRLLSNQSLLIVPPDGGLDATQYTFGGIADTYVMFQLDVAGAAEMPFSRLWGRTVTGLGQINESDEKMYEERIQKDQSTHMAPGLESKLLPVVMMSELGEIPRDFKLDFPSVRVPSPETQMNHAKTLVDVCSVAYNSGIISPRQFGEELAEGSKINGTFSNLDPDSIAKLSDEPIQPAGEMDDLFGEEEGAPSLDPSESPQRVLREEGRERMHQAHAADAEFEENEHPRDENGKFISKHGEYRVFHREDFKDRDNRGPQSKHDFIVARHFPASEWSDSSGARGVNPEYYREEGASKTQTGAQRKAKQLAKELEEVIAKREYNRQILQKGDDLAHQLSRHGIKASVYQAPTGSTYVTLKDVKSSGKQSGQGFEIKPQIRLADHPGRHWEPTEWDYDLSKNDPKEFAEKIAQQLKDEDRATDISIGRARDSDEGQMLRTVGPFQVVVETAKDRWRTGPGWRNRMPAHYGYVVGYQGADGDSIDCYIGENPDSNSVYVVDQMRLDKPRVFDEHKVVMGANTRNQALDIYMRGHHRSSRVFGAITPMTMEAFQDWLRTADLTKPCSSKVRGRLW